MVASAISERMVTILPAPLAGVSRAAVHEAFARHPRYLRLIESWRWMSPLWSLGIIESLHAGDDAIDDVRRSAGRVGVEPAWAPLRPYAHEETFAADAGMLDQLPADLLKGGPDPGISVPMAAGLDAFAARHGCWSVRAGVRDSAGSLAGRAEGHLGRLLVSFAMPVFTQASGRVILALREELAQETASLRSAILASAEPSRSGSLDVRRAAGEYARAFDIVTRDRLDRDDETGLRICAGMAHVQVRVLPVDAALISSIVALRQVRARSGVAEIRPVSAPSPDGEVRALVVSPMGGVSFAPDTAGAAGTAGDDGR
jgi:hypothetical protein